MDTKMINLKDIFNSLSTALDFTYSGLSGHHKRVAYMAAALGKKMLLPGDIINRLYMSSIIHDIGAISMNEKENLGKLEIEDPYTHSELGSRMVGKVSFLELSGRIIMHHHDAWKGGNPSGLRGDEIPLESRIINAVDRLDVLIDQDRCLLHQTDCVMGRLKELSGNILDPDILAELSDLAAGESFWLDLDPRFLPDRLCSLMEDFDIYITGSMVKDISLLFSEVIDSKSVFTHRHSRLVAATARKLAQAAGFSQSDTEKTVVAGLLHDLGKLSVPEEILEKPGRLTPDEFRVMKRHTYYTHRILDRISDFAEINRWASFHHERLDGAGYPFRLKGEDIPQGSRIVAVSDVFSALAEDRPYRKGMARKEITAILLQMSGCALDPDLVKLLLENYDHFDDLGGHEDPLSVE